MIDEDKIESTLIFNNILQTLQHTLMHDDPIIHSCMLMDLLGDVSPEKIGLYGVNDCVSMGSHE